MWLLEKEKRPFMAESTSQMAHAVAKFHSLAVHSILIIMQDCSYFMKKACHFDCVAFLACCVSLVFISSGWGEAVEREKANQFETLASHTSGLLTDVPEVVRSLRVGSVTQKVTLRQDGVMKIVRSFSCKNASGIGAKENVAVSVREICLADLQDPSVCRYEVNRHVNTINIIQREWSIPLSFRSTADLDKATILLRSLVASAPPTPRKAPFSRASLAEEAGFQYLVIAPRCEEVSEEVRLLALPDPSPCLLCYLTKSKPDQIESLLQESMNRLPLFIYDVKILDECPFFTEPIPGATSFFPCSMELSLRQSVYSDDAALLTQFFHHSPYVGICFETMPNLSSPIAILCTPSDEHKMRKTAKGVKIQVKGEDSYTACNLADGEEMVRKSAPSWISGRNDNSDDILRYCLLKTTLTPTLLSYTLYSEFPSLRHLLQSKSRVSKDLTLEQAICLTSSALARYPVTLSEFASRVVRVALFSHELGSSFGSEKELAYDSWPFALSIAERVGCHEEEKKAIQALIDDHTPYCFRKMDVKKKIDPLFLALSYELQAAYEARLCLKDWLDIKECFYTCLASCPKSSEVARKMVLTIQSIRKKYASLLPFGSPRGLTYCQGTLPTHSLCSSVIWETRDPHHRGGLPLRRWREKFEHLIIDNAKTALKGHFWEWLEKQVRDEPLYPNRFLRHEGKKQYRATYEGGVLTSPLLEAPQGTLEVLFVLDSFEDLYIGVQKEGDKPHEEGFTHASFLGGRPVAAAGKLVLKNGKLAEISDQCAYYSCGRNGLKIAIQALEKMGVPLEGVAVSAMVTGERRRFATVPDFLASM